MALKFIKSLDETLPDSLECYVTEDEVRGNLIGYIDQLYNTLGNLTKYVACFCMSGDELQPDLTIYVHTHTEGKEYITEQYMAYLMTGVLERSDEEV